MTPEDYAFRFGQLFQAVRTALLTGMAEDLAVIARLSDIKPDQIAVGLLLPRHTSKAKRGKK